MAKQKPTEPVETPEDEAVPGTMPGDEYEAEDAPVEYAPDVASGKN